MNYWCFFVDDCKFIENSYNETLETVRNSFPQYIRELEGVADGAQVDFYKVSDISK